MEEIIKKEEISSGIKENTTLRKYNFLNTTLRKLYLMNNGIGSEGARYISLALKENKTLREINLMSNEIGLEGAKYISEALRENKTLEKLDLWDNGIKNEGGKEIEKLLEKNTTLIKISLGLIKIDWRILKRINVKLKRNRRNKERLKPLTEQCVKEIKEK